MSLIHCVAISRRLNLSGLSPALQGELMGKTLALVSDTSLSNPAWLLHISRRRGESPSLGLPVGIIMAACCREQ